MIAGDVQQSSNRSNNMPDKYQLLRWKRWMEILYQWGQHLAISFALSNGADVKGRRTLAEIHLYAGSSLVTEDWRGKISRYEKESRRWVKANARYQPKTARPN